MKFLLRFIGASIVGYLFMWHMPGHQVLDQAGTVLAAVAIAIMNSFITPTKAIRRFPITIYTLLIIMTVLNALVVKLCSMYVPGFEIDGWGRPLLTGFIMAEEILFE